MTVGLDAASGDDDPLDGDRGTFDPLFPQEALHDAGGKPIRRDATGASGDDVGTELDIFLAYTFKTHHWVGLEICRFWSGDFVENTGFADAAWFGWLSCEFKF